MSRFESVLAFGVLFSVAAGGVAHAEEERAADSKVKVKLANDDDGRGASFSVGGECMPLPDGTRLEVRLLAKGPTKDVVCAVFRVRVEKNHFSGQKTWKTQTLAPLSYRADVILDLSDQSERIRSWCMEQYGFPVAHKELVESQDVGIGSVEEQATFARENLERLRQFTLDLEALRADVEAACAKPAAEQEGWEERVVALNERVGKFRQDFERYSLGYVVLLERGFLQRLQTALKAIGRGLIAHHDGEAAGGAEVVATKGEIALLLDHIEQLLPAQDEGPLVHPDAQKPGEEGKR